MLLEKDEVTRAAFVLALRARGVIADDDLSADVPADLSAYFQSFDTGAEVPSDWLAMQANVDYGTMTQGQIAETVWRELQSVPLNHPLIIGYVGARRIHGDLLRAVAVTAFAIDDAAGVHRKAG